MSVRPILQELANTVLQPYLILESGNSLVRVPVRKIQYWKSTSRQLLIVTESGNITLKCAIGFVEQLLEDHHFLRIHESFLVNVHCVVSFWWDEVRMNDGKVLPLRRYRSKETRSKFQEIFGQTQFEERLQSPKREFTVPDHFAYGYSSVEFPVCAAPFPAPAAHG